MWIQAVVCAVVLYGLYRFVSSFKPSIPSAKEPPMSDYERGRMSIRDAFYDESGNLRAGAVGMPPPAGSGSREDTDLVYDPVPGVVTKSQWHKCDPLAADPECAEPYMCISADIDNTHPRCMTNATAKFHCEYRKPRNRWDAKVRRCVSGARFLP